MDNFLLVYYLLIVADNISFILGLIAVLCIFYWVFLFLFAASYLIDAEGNVSGKLPIKTSIAFTAIIFVGLVMIPDKEDSYGLLAVYAGQELAKLEETKEIGSKTYKVINKVLDDYLEEAK